MSETESTENVEKFYELSEDSLELVENVIEKISMSFNIKIKIIGNAKMKKLVEIKKHSDYDVYLNNIELSIFINEDYLIKLEEKIAEILIFQELDRLEFDLSKGTFKLGKFQLQTNPGVLKKYGIDAVAEANQLVDLFTQQKADGADDQFDVNTTPKKSIKKDFEFLED